MHHIVEQGPADLDGLPASMIDAPENIVLIPAWKHQEITRWYMKKNKKYDGLSPREYLRGKDWEERVRVGLKALRRHKVLKK